MKLITYAKTIEDLNTLKESGVKEVILGHRALSRVSDLDDAQIQELAKAAKAHSIRPVLEWDILMREPEFQKAVDTLNRIDFSLFEAVRVQDPGAIEYVLKEIPQIPLQLILETGNHNLEGIQRWCQYAGERLDRIVLSIEIPKERIRIITKNISCPVEIIGLAPVLLFYTPRHLLSYQKNDLSWVLNEKDVANHEIMATASSEEGFHKGFRILENQHGSFVFYPKDYCLLDKIPDLKSIGISYLRIDQRLEKDLTWLQKASGLLEDFTLEAASAFKEAYPHKVTRCFFQSNATDVLFKKLKNWDIQREDSNFLGEIIEVTKSHSVILKLTGKANTLRKGDQLKLINPQGKEVLHEVSFMRDLEKEPLEIANKGDLVVLPYIKSITVRSAVYRHDS
jgi:U32 family peptidase